MPRQRSCRSGAGQKETTPETVSARSAFHIRSAERDLKADADRIASVAAAIDAALKKIKVERTGLVDRIKTVVDLSDKCTARNKQLSEVSVMELARAEERLIALARGIALFSSLRESLRSHSPKKRRSDRS